MGTSQPGRESEANGMAGFLLLDVPVVEATAAAGR